MKKEALQKNADYNEGTGKLRKEKN